MAGENVTPVGAMLPLYIVFSISGFYLAYLQYITHADASINRDADLVRKYRILTLVSLALSLLSTILSIPHWPDPAVRNIVGAHFNVCTDLPTIISVVITLIVLTMKRSSNWLAWVLAFFSTAAGVVGILSSIASTYSVRDSGFGMVMSSWWIGLICLVVGGIVWVIGEIADD